MIPVQYVELVGSVAGCLTTLAFLPQVLRVWRTKSVRDISLLTYIALTCGVFLWFLYGLGVGSYPIITANGITFVLSLSILVMKLRYARR
ncbi:SemiSWEET transporter [Desulfovibrio psychrotolerans]|uniref:Sugar transporter SemiSWEET n=1 Tax=Desulfovibrio psychrotolerans TaxID=415242 RepID=A0A7J0BTB7_9BACT|nr:SemiSWEET transporter [Desulfovibrio psychrotolerans]GFM36375.1 hypothetical protein DSM19430T_10590 [Desulfovibrio psychrotolerans]